MWDETFPPGAAGRSTTVPANNLTVGSMEGGGGGEVEGGEEVGEGFSAADLDDGAIGTQEELSGAA